MFSSLAILVGISGSAFGLPLDRLIHYEPIRKEVLRYAFPTEDKEGRLSEHFGKAPYFVLVTVRASDGEVLDRQVFPNEFLDVPKGKGILVSEWLAHNGVDFLYIKSPSTSSSSNRRLTIIFWRHR